jgi:23S rRNA pseudouridine2605 synthase
MAYRNENKEDRAPKGRDKHSNSKKFPAGDAGKNSRPERVSAKKGQRSEGKDTQGKRLSAGRTSGRDVSRFKLNEDSSETKPKRNFSGGKFEKRRPSFKSGYKPKNYKSKNIEDTELIRLNKYISNSGICSRREADTYIQNGVVTVNGKVITGLGYKVQPTDKVKFDGRQIKPEKFKYLLLNKPKNFITTSDDPEGRKTVMQLIKGACKERLYPVGRLDRNTTGLLLFTNDGLMTEKLMHPRRNVRKIYHVELDKGLSAEDFQVLKEGVQLEDGFFKPDQLEYTTPVGGDKRHLGIEIHSGKNRIVRRLFEHLNYTVIKLDRVMYAGLTKKNLPRGHWRFLDEAEVNFLKMI